MLQVQMMFGELRNELRSLLSKRRSGVVAALVAACGRLEICQVMPVVVASRADLSPSDKAVLLQTEVCQLLGEALRPQHGSHTQQVS
jgi:hypothetical protein